MPYSPEDYQLLAQLGYNIGSQGDSTVVQDPTTGQFIPLDSPEGQAFISQAKGGTAKGYNQSDLQILNLGAGLNTPMQAINPRTGQPETVLATTGENGQQTFYFPSDSGNRPANASQAMAGGYSSGNDGSLLGDLAGAAGTFGLGSLGFGVGALSGASAATGNGVTPQTVAADAAGLAGGYGLAGAGLGTTVAPGALAPSGLGGTEGLGLEGAASGASSVAPGGLGGTEGLGLTAASAPAASTVAPGGLGGTEGLGLGTAGTTTAAAGGAAAATGAAGGGGGLGGGGSAVPWYADPRFLGPAAMTLGSVYGDTQIANANRDLANQYMALGAPSRARYEATFDPNFDINSIPGLQSAMDTSSQSILRGLSTQGNPYGNPGALAEAQKYIMGNVALPTLQNYRNQNAATGGYNAFSTAAPAAASNAITAGGNVYSDIGRGIGNAVNPPPTLDQYFQRLVSGSNGSRSLA